MIVGAAALGEPEAVDPSVGEPLADGDDVGLSALMYNRATALVANVRLAGVDGAVEDADATTAWKEAALCVQSFAAYEAGIGGAAMAYMVPLLHAQVLAAQGQPAQALVLYERWSGDATRAGARRLRPLLAADAAWCRVQVGQLDAARRDLATALPDADAGCDLDDRVLANARLAQVARALGEAALADTLRDRARRDLAVLRAEQSRLSDLLDDALAELVQRLGDGFVRVHRNALVARRAVRALERRTLEGEEGWAVRVAPADEWLAVSRRQLAAVREALAR